MLPKQRKICSHKSSWLKILIICLNNAPCEIFLQMKYIVSTNLIMENIEQLYLNDKQNIIIRENSKLRTYN